MRGPLNADVRSHESCRMQLTRTQVQSLKRSLAFHRSGGYSIRTVIWWSRWKFLIFAAILGGAALFYWWAGWSNLAMLFLGVLIGTFSRDLTWMRLNQKAWPLNDHIVDWNLVERIVAENQDRAT